MGRRITSYSAECENRWASDFDYSVSSLERERDRGMTLVIGEGCKLCNGMGNIAGLLLLTKHSYLCRK